MNEENKTWDSKVADFIKKLLLSVIGYPFILLFGILVGILLLIGCILYLPFEFIDENIWHPQSKNSNSVY